MENFGMTVSQLPPGFRFHPTDQELMIHYLRKKVTSNSSSTVTSIIADVDLYKYNPWELPEKALFGEGEGEWFFFSPRDRKYPNGGRPNRAAACGYWKATGTDKPILGCGGSECLGVKKALVFYKGRPPKGIKTDWVMHEYRLIHSSSSSTHSSLLPQKHKATSMRLDEWVLCRVRKRGVVTQSDDETSRSQRSYQQPPPPPPLPLPLLLPLPPAIEINNSEKLQPPSEAAAAAAALEGNLYEWSDNQLLAYLLNSSSSSSSSSSLSQQEGLMGETTTTTTTTSSSSSSSNENSGSTTNSLEGSIATAAEYGYGYGYGSYLQQQQQQQQQPAQIVVSSMLDSIKRKLSFGALDELIMLQPPTKRLHFSITTHDQLDLTDHFLPS